MQKSRRKENILSILDAVTIADCLTRSEIATETGLSTVTVGKAVESLMDCGLFSTYTVQRKGAGRKQEKIKVAEDRLFVVLDLSGYDMVMETFDVRCEQYEVMSFHELADFSYHENLRMFMHRVKQHMLNNKKYKYLGICLIVPGHYDKQTDTVVNAHPGFNEMKLRAFIRQAVCMPIDMVIDSKRASMRYCINRGLPTDNILLLNIDRQIEACIAMSGREIVNGSNSVASSETDLPGQVADIIAGISSLVTLNWVFIQTEGLNSWLTRKQMEDLIDDKLERKRLIPRVNVINNRSYARLGAAFLLSRGYVRQTIVN